MSRSLYRCYLYFVALLMLFYLSTGLYQILDILLQQTSLRGSASSPPTRADAVRLLTAAAIALFIGGGIGGLHYWLIQRDRRNDPHVGESGARSFFLNGGEAIAVLVFIGQVVGFVSQYGDAPSSSFNLATPLEIAFTALVVVAVLERERRSARPTAGVALTFQRLHEYGVPFALLLFVITPTWHKAISELVSSVVVRDASNQPCDQTGSCVPAHQPVFFWLAALLAVLSLVWFAWLARHDARSRIRQFLHLASFAYGAIWFAAGLRSGVEHALRVMLGVSASRASAVDVITSVVFGLLVALAFGIWLRREAVNLPIGLGAIVLSVEAIVCLVFAVPFWLGAGATLHDLVESIVPAGAFVSRGELALALSFLSMGVVYAVVARDLVRRTKLLRIAGPNRAVTLALLAAGTLTTAIGAAATLYVLVTTLLLPASTNWQEQARTSIIALVVGASLVGLYVWRGRREGAFAPIHLRPTPALIPDAAPTEPRDAIADVLDQFSAGKLTRDEAANRLRELTRP
ncbi:MAG TPA: DUF5671 domain-containing protein [Ktedonobacterales bacterium]|nr:DUF5671 domain-containing protein [Ktedonobacterales bacterium]